MQVDVVDVGRLQAGHAQRRFHGQARAQALGMGGRHVVRVAGLADATKEDVVDERLIGALDQHEGRTLAHGDAIALGIEGPARLAGDQL